MTTGDSQAARGRYDDARRQAQTLGFEYLENAYLLALPTEARLERIEALLNKGKADDPQSRAALLGTEKRPDLKLSKLFGAYEEATRDERRDFSPDQLRIGGTNASGRSKTS